MGKAEACICAAYAFLPAFIFFVRFVAKEPLRIILFMLGGFFWLCALLFTSIVWKVQLFFTDSPIIIMVVIILAQEVARFLFLIIARRTYDGLTKLNEANKVIIPDIQLLAASSRHTFAFVCGLGIGTIACFLSTSNIIADLTRDGVPGFPDAVAADDCPIHRSFADVDVPFAYCLGASTLVFLNACWTILQWDSGHKFIETQKHRKQPGHENDPLPSFWWLGFVFSFVSHFVNTILSLFSIGGNHWFVLAGQALLLVANIILTLRIVGFHPPASWGAFLVSPGKTLTPKTPKTAQNGQILQNASAASAAAAAGDDDVAPQAV